MLAYNNIIVNGRVAGMKRILSISLIIAVVVSILGTFPASAKEPMFEPGVVLVGLYPGFDAALLMEYSIFTGVIDVLMEFDPVTFDGVEKIAAIYLSDQNPNAVFKAIKILKTVPGIAYTGLDWILHIITGDFAYIVDVSKSEDNSEDNIEVWAYSDNCSAIVVLAVYDQDGKKLLKFLPPQNLQNGLVVYTFEGAAIPNTMAKAFVWNNLIACAPLAEGFALSTIE